MSNNVRGYEAEQAIFDSACAAAQAASDAAEALPNQSWFPCGFAWIVISPARGRFITFLKRAGIGSKNYGGGYRVSSYAFSSQSPQWSQSMNVKESATRAASDVLAHHGIRVTNYSRMD